MRNILHISTVLIAGAVLWVGTPSGVDAQLGRQRALVEPNVASDAALAALPNINAETVEALKAACPSKA